MIPISQPLEEKNELEWKDRPSKFTNRSSSTGYQPESEHQMNKDPLIPWLYSQHLFDLLPFIRFWTRWQPISVALPQ